MSAKLPPFAVLGAGRIGQAISHDLLQSGAEGVLVVDVDRARSEALVARLRDKRAEALSADLGRPETLRPILARVGAVISAVPYRLNLGLAKETVAAGASWTDLGGNTEIVEATLALGPKAKRHRACVIPDAGLQPGLGNILAGEIHRRLGGADMLRVLVGGLPQKPTGKLKYMFVFSVEGLLNEYEGQVRTLLGGKLKIRRPLSEVERFLWEGFPELECFHTSGSASTLPGTFARRVGRLEVKTVRYAGHAAELRRIFLAVPKEKRAAFLDEIVPKTGRDLVLMRVEGTRKGARLAFEMEDRYDPKTGLTSMMRTTGFPASILAQLAAKGELARGAVIQERDVPARPVIEALMRRGIRVREA